MLDFSYFFFFFFLSFVSSCTCSPFFPISRGGIPAVPRGTAEEKARTSYTELVRRVF